MTQVIKSEPFILNIGPQHPSTHGVFRIKATVDGEKVIDAEMVMGYLHRSMEKLAEEPMIVADTDVSEEVEAASTPPPIEEFEFDYEMTQQWTPPPPREEVEEEEVEEPAEPVVVSEEFTDEVIEEEPVEEVLPDGLAITLLDDDEEFYSGKAYTLRVLITNRLRGDEKPLSNPSISIKILGTTFRPLIYSLKTESDGVASVATEIPQFSSGRAAVLVRAVVKDQAAELRRIIHPAA